VRLEVNFKRRKANDLAGADLVWHCSVASIGKSLAPTGIGVTPATRSSAREVLPVPRYPQDQVAGFASQPLTME